MTLLTVLIAACLFFIQGDVAVVYSQGVSINFSGLSVSGTQTSTQVWGDSGTQTATSVPATSGTQNVSPGSVTISLQTPTTQTTTSTSSTTTSITPASTSQQYTSSTQTPFTSYNTPEHTTEITLPVNFNSLSGEEPLLPLAEPYVVTICLSYNDMTASGCVDKKTPSQASEKLAAMILNK
jgi:hypothetical protein